MKVEILDGIMGSGKALLNGTSVVTPNGYVPIEKLSVGDLVIGEDGKPHKVLGVYPQGVKSMYKLTFSDRNEIVCCEDHLWTFQKPQDKKVCKYRTMSVKQLLSEKLFTQTDKCKNWNIHIPISKPVEFDSNSLPLNPYLLGLMLGDGCLQRKVSFVNGEDDILEKFKKIVGVENVRSYHRTNATQLDLKVCETRTLLRELFPTDLKSGDKFIPKEYLTSTIDDRYNLVRGLMDTDASCCGGYFEYSTVSKQLAEDMTFILESLGCTVTTSLKENVGYTHKGVKLQGQNCYRLFIRCDDLKLLVSSEKHLSRIKAVKTKPNRTLRSIEKVGSSDCTCIMVDNPTKLFLTEHFIPTHNTTSICKWMDDAFVKDATERFFYVSPLLSEVQEDGGRIHKQCNHVKFVSPESIGRSSKSKHLLSLLQDGVNIACTHSLYLNMTEDHFTVMRKLGYNLIIDEEVGMIGGYNAYSQSDCDSLIDLGCISKQESDGMLVWNKEHTAFDNRDHKYHEFKRHVENGLIYACKHSNSMMVTQLPVKLLDVAKRVIILTYMFEGNILSSFLKLKGIDYVPFTEVTLQDVPKQTIRDLITIHKPRFFRQWQFMDDLPLTYTWYSGRTITKEKRITTKNVNDITKYIKSVRNACGADWKDVLYTFPKCRSLLDENSRMAKINPEDLKRVDVLQEKQTWLASNTRATNTLSHKWCLIHCYNRYPTQSVMQYLRDYSINVDNDVFALSEMLQWVWRSRIRNGEEIYLAIASKRMRILFYNWLNDGV